MSGNSVQIFSILIVGMLLFNGTRDIMKVQKAFEKLENRDQPSSLLFPKCVYVLLNATFILLAMYKCYHLGLLPTEGWQSVVNKVAPGHYSITPVLG
jgi:hypothetical protein